MHGLPAGRLDEGFWVGEGDGLGLHQVVTLVEKHVAMDGQQVVVVTSQVGQVQTDAVRRVDHLGRRRGKSRGSQGQD